MKMTAELPLYGGFSDPSSIRRVVRSLEEAGFAALGVTDHPAPSRKWGDTRLSIPSRHWPSALQ